MKLKAERVPKVCPGSCGGLETAGTRRNATYLERCRRQKHAYQRSVSGEQPLPPPDSFAHVMTLPSTNTATHGGQPCRSQQPGAQPTIVSAQQMQRPDTIECQMCSTEHVTDEQRHPAEHQSEGGSNMSHQQYKATDSPRQKWLHGGRIGHGPRR